MNEVPSATFRKTYAKLTGPTTVTVNGHPIGTWLPANWDGELDRSHRRIFEEIEREFQLPRQRLPGGGIQARQAQRDALLRGINRSK